MTLLPALAIATISFTGPGPAAPTPPGADGLALPPSTACAGQDDLAAPIALQLRAMRCVVNATRTSVGVRRLRTSRRLNRVAALRARAIRRCGQFSHRPCGESFIGVFVRTHYLGSGAAGENLAWGQAPRGTARDAVADWLGSTEHRGNLLDGGWRDVGIAVVKAPSLFGAEDVTLWVIDFGRH